MRILSTFVGGRGHLGPLVPIALASRAAGHTVAFDVRSAAEDVLSDPSYQQVAQRLRAEMAAQPDAAYVVTLLEGLC